MVKAFTGFFLFVILLILLLVIIIRIPAVQKKLKDISSTALQEQLNSNVSIGGFRLELPKKLKVSDILIATNESDTLVYLGEFSVNIELFPLFNRKIIAKKIELINAKGDIGKLLKQIPTDSTTTNEVQVEKEDTDSWKLAVNQLYIESSYIEYRDEEVGFELIMDIGELYLHVGSMNLDTLISCSKIEISDTRVSYETLPTTGDTDTSTFEFADIRVEKAFLKNSKFTYIDSTSAIIFYARGNKVNVSDLLVDITSEKVVINEGFAGDTHCAVEFLPENDTTPKSNDYLNWGQSLWRVEGNSLVLDDYKFTIDYLDKPDPKGHFNNEHMNFYDVTGKLSNFVLDYDILEVEIHSLSGKEINGFNILELNAKMNQEGSQFSIRDMEINTANSEYSANLSTTISPTNYLELEDKSFNLTLDIESSNWNDIDYFYSFLHDYDFLSEDFVKGDFELKTKVGGGLDSLLIEQFSFQYLDSTQIITDGNVVGLMNPDSLKYDLQINKLMISKANVDTGFSNIITDSSYSLPEFMVVAGRFIGSSEEYYFEGDIKSNIGEVSVSYAEANFVNIPSYNLKFVANLSKLNTIENIGVDAAAFEMNGSFKGENLYDAVSDIHINIDSLIYNKYNYRDMDFIGQLANGQFDAQVSSLDTNFHFAIITNGNLFEDKQDVDVDMNVEKIDLQALNFYDQELKFKGDAVFAVNVSKENNYSMDVKIHSLDLCFSDTLYKMHPAEMYFVTNNSSTDFKLSSYYYNLDFTADEYILDVINSIKDLPGYYLADAENDSAKFTLPAFQVAGQLNYPEAFARLFFPDLPAFERLTIDGAYNHTSDEIDFNMSMPGISYNTVFADSLLLSISGSSKRLDYFCHTTFKIEEMIAGKLNIFGKFENSELITGVQYFDSFSTKYLDITTLIVANNEKITAHIIPDSLVFSYDHWKINPDNSFVYNPSYTTFTNFELSSNSQYISINSFPEINAQNLELKLNNFDLGSLEQLFALDTIVAGIANADFTFTDLYNSPAIEGSITIDDIILQGFEAGKLSISKIEYKNDIAFIEMALTGNYEDVTISGDYNMEGEKDLFDLSMDITSLDLSDLNYLLDDYINDAEGILSGNLKISGNSEDPVINGNLNFKDAGVGIISLHNYFTLGNEVITIKDNVIDFDEFSMINKNGQSAKVFGKVSFGTATGTYSDLHVKTENMEIMNSTRDDSDILFGYLKAQTDIDITGPQDNIKVNTNVKIDKSTDITYIFPETLAVNDNRGVVRFGKYHGDSINEIRVPENHPLFSAESFNEIKAQIEIFEGTHFKLFFDSGGKNYLDASLNGTMNYDLLEDNTEISGIFEIDKGQLRYGIPLVTVDKYQIEPGSYISLSNDIYNPYVNIIASSDVRASTEGLMSDYNKVMTFKILLYMNGELNNVKLRFDISSETNDAIVSARLAQLTDQERNINALNLLARGAFIISVQGTEAGGTSMANAQIDKFYANQLNHLISDNFHFVDLHFDVQSFTDFGASGEQVFRRNYYYDVGKSFFKDRARINYKGSLGFTSDQKAEQINSNFVQNELEVEIKITKDGRFRGVFFRKDKYEGLLEGEVVETGGGIRYKKSFYSIKDMFIKDSRKKKENK